MSPHLDDLRRQRALVHEHLQWLDREIARAASAQPAARADAPEKRVEPPVVATPPAHDIAPPVSELDPRSLHGEVRRGCLVYAALAAAALAALVAFIFWKY